MDKQELLALAERLSDYGLTLDQQVVICDRRVVDEAVQALRAIASQEGK